MWEDKAPLDKRKVMRSGVTGLIGIEVPEEEFERAMKFPGV